LVTAAAFSGRSLAGICTPRPKTSRREETEDNTEWPTAGKDDDKRQHGSQLERRAEREPPWFTCAAAVVL
jgi:hypothetical protein